VCSVALCTAVTVRWNVIVPPEVKAAPVEVVAVTVIVWPVVVARLWRSLVNVNLRLVLDVVT